MRASTAATPGISAIWSTSVFGARRTTAKTSANAIALVIGGARLIERPVGADGQDERRDAAGDDQRDGQRLGPEPAQVAKAA